MRAKKKKDKKREREQFNAFSMETSAPSASLKMLAYSSQIGTGRRFSSSAGTRAITAALGRERMGRSRVSGTAPSKFQTWGASDE